MTQGLESEVAEISRCFIYPVKSWDSVELKKLEFQKGGCIKFDRQFAFFDARGKTVNAKRHAKMQTVRARYDLDEMRVFVRLEGEENHTSFLLQEEGEQIEAWLSNVLDTEVFFRESTDGCFLDMPDWSGVTIVSEASLQDVAQLFHIGYEECIRRFRPNVVVQGVSAYWEDTLFRGEGEKVLVHLDDVVLWGLSPRERCVVPTRQPETAEISPSFTRRFSEFRRDRLPAFSMLPGYGHYYYLCTDLFIPPSAYGRHIQVGDSVQVIG